MWSRARLASKGVWLGLAMGVCLGMAGIVVAHPADHMKMTKSADVYVCDCMGNKSCPCMGMSNKEGKCTCGKEMKAVPRKSAWAEHNRKELK